MKIFSRQTFQKLTKRNYKRWTPPNLSQVPYFAVLGLHSSGSSALAGALCLLNVSMGTRFVGYHGVAPYFGGEDAELSEFLERHLPVPSRTCRFNDADVRRWLDEYLTRRRADALQAGTVAGGKYPQLAAIGDLLFELLGDNLRVIVCERPFDESTRSLQKRFPNELPEAIAAHQRFIDEHIRRLVAQVAPEKTLRVEFRDTIGATRETIDRLAAFVRPEADEASRRAAVEHIRPELKHF